MDENITKKITNLLFEAKILKHIPRSGYHFLGSGSESVAEHSFMITFIAFVISEIEPDIDPLKLLQMCLLHDLPEARTGDLNYVQKKYASIDENKAIQDFSSNLPFGSHMKQLLDEFNKGETSEAKLAKDADQLSFILELKYLSDTGRKEADNWLPIVVDRLMTETGKKIGNEILKTPWDEWWKKNYVD